MPTSIPKILAIIPCYNEAGSIGKLLAEFASLPFSCDTVVIDDGSSDNTETIAQNFTRVIRLEKNAGVFAALKTGILFAQENNYDYCIQIDGDGQHIPGQIGKMIAAGRVSGAHFLLGSRYCRDPVWFSGGARRWAGLLLSLMLYGFFRRQWVWDPFSGMRMMDKEAMAHMLTLPDDYADIMVVACVLKRGLSYTEVPVTMRSRLNGTSHFTGLKGARFFLRVVANLLAFSFFHK